jgi:hypothetical protein
MIRSAEGSRDQALIVRMYAALTQCEHPTQSRRPIPIPSVQTQLVRSDVKAHRIDPDS